MNAMHRRTFSSFSGARGFTLIELMISLVIGMIILIALAAVYSSISRTNNEMAKSHGVIENGRLAIDLLQEDVEHAGYWGGYVPQWDDFSSTFVYSSPYNTASMVVPDPCLTYSASNWTTTYTYSLVSIPVQTYQSVPSTCSTYITNKQANTDILVVRHAETCLPGVGNCEASSATKVYFQPTFCSNEMSLAAAGTPTFYIGYPASLTLTQRDCTTASGVRKVVSDIYYIRTYSSTTTDGIPTLVRVRLDGTGYLVEPLIEGIESLVVELGVDSKDRCGNSINYSAAPVLINPLTCLVDTTTSKNTMPNNRGDGVPESYIRCATSGCDVAHLRDVVSVKLYLLARSSDSGVVKSAVSRTYKLGGSAGSYSVDSTGTTSAGTSTFSTTFTTPYYRHVFETTVRLNNVSGRREAPAS